MKTKILGVILVIALVSCAPVPATKVTDILQSPATLQDVVITLERTMCFGSCPVYLLTIKGDGTVIFDGRKYVKDEGQHITTISQEDVKALVLEFERINYFSFSNFTDYDMTDMPYAITSITINGTTTTVEHYHGDGDAPKELFELERKIDKVSNSTQWIGE
ncbi:MAG: hypothetical protein IT331_20400 [Anaerolineae bacterium]|nr:hypothetical protein [Anaerolineae bacterium]